MSWLGGLVVLIAVVWFIQWEPPAPSPAAAAEANFHAMHCKRVGYTSDAKPFDRCESEEALCFAQGEGGLMCIWKDLK